MDRDTRHHQQTEDGSLTLYSVRYGQTYHSRHGARTECHHVFLEASGAADILRRGEPLRVLEIGFGTGLNFLLTADLAVARGTPLHYTAIERDLVGDDVFASLGYESLLGASHLIDRLRRWVFAIPSPGLTGLITCRLHDTLHLELLLGDATDTPIPTPAFDVVYQDAFSPDANPELWTPAFLARLFAALKPGGRLSTYASRATVRRALVESGFTVSTIPGPPGKREITVATRPPST